MEFISVSRLILSILIFTFVVYLIPGMFGAPLKALAGYLPPMSTHDFNLLENGPNYQIANITDEEKFCDKPKSIGVTDSPVTSDTTPRFPFAFTC